MKNGTKHFLWLNLLITIVISQASKWLLMRLYMVYGRRCRSPIYWEEIGERKYLGPKLVQQAEEKLRIIREHLKAAQNRQKHQANLKRRAETR
jgi:hypothetical protein